MRTFMRSAKGSRVAAVAAFAAFFLTGARAADSLRIEGGQIADAAPDASGIRVFKGIPYAAPPVGELRWKAPQPVQPWNGIRSITEWGPRFRKDNQAQQLPGCLQYGNRGDMTKGDFLSIDGDRARVADELARGCQSAAASAEQAQSSAIEYIKTVIRNFFPSDAKYPGKTMLQFDSTIQIQPKGSSSYTSVMNYSVTKLGGEGDGSVDGMTIEADFRGPVASLLPAFFQSNHSEINPSTGKPMPLQVKREGEISFQVSDVHNPVLAYGTYTFWDRESRRVGSIDLPVFISGK